MHLHAMLSQPQRWMTLTYPRVREHSVCLVHVARVPLACQYTRSEPPPQRHRLSPAIDFERYERRPLLDTQKCLAMTHREVRLHHDRHTRAQQSVEEKPDQLERRPSKLLRPRTVRPAEAVKQRLLEIITAEHGEPQSR